MKVLFALFAVLLVAGCGSLGEAAADRGEAIVFIKGRNGGMKEAILGPSVFCTYLGALKLEDMTPDQITAFLAWCQLQAP